METGAHIHLKELLMKIYSKFWGNRMISIIGIIGIKGSTGITWQTAAVSRFQSTYCSCFLSYLSSRTRQHYSYIYVFVYIYIHFYIHMANHCSKQKVVETCSSGRPLQKADSEHIFCYHGATLNTIRLLVWSGRFLPTGRQWLYTST